MSLSRDRWRPDRLLLVAAVLVMGAVGLIERHVHAQADPLVLDPGLSVLEIGQYEQAAREGLGYLPNEVLVKFKDGTTRGEAQRALMAIRSRPGIDDLRWAGDVAIVIDLGQSNADILTEQLREQPEVSYAQPNYLRHPDRVASTTLTPNDPSFGTRQWDMAALDMPRTWAINRGDDVTVAVVDTGITNFTGNVQFQTWSGTATVAVTVPFIVNPDLPASRLVAPRDFATGRGDIILDMDGHGTHVSGTVGEQTNNGLMLAGMAYNTKIMPVKVCLTYWDVQFARSAQGIPGFAPLNSGGCPDASDSQGIHYAVDNGAKVINFSIGGTQASPILQDALTYASSKGAFVAISAGNSYDAGNAEEYPAKYADTMDGVMAVAAVGKSLRHAYYSTSASYVEIAAPGGDQREAGLPGGIWQSTIRQSDSDPASIIFPRFDHFDETSFQGTSMASPHVAGLAALLTSQLRAGATPALIEQIIKRTAHACSATDCSPTISSGARNDFFGAGLIQPRPALFGMGLGK